MTKTRLFIENMLVYGLGGIISKIIPVIMIPIITRLLPDTSYYGISDLCSTIVSLGTSLAVLGMYDAMYRMFFEKDDEEYKRTVCSTAVLFCIFFSLFISFVVFVLKDAIAETVFRNTEYNYLVIIAGLAIFTQATNSIIAAPTRMQNQRKIFLVTNTVGPILSYSVSIPLILAGHYVIALPVAGLICGLVMEIAFYTLNRKWFCFYRFDLSLLKQLLKLGIPLFPTFIFYWIFNSSDKLMISNLIDTAAVGIYATGSKLGHCSQLIYTAFAGGWQYFAFSTMKDQNQVKNNSLIFEYLGIISFISSMFIFVFCKPIYEVIFTGDYIKGYIVSPYLFLAPLLLMLYQVIGNQFLVIKKTWPSFIALSIGAISNVLMNFYLIPILGIEGAAISTLIGYAITTCICSAILLKMKLLIISNRFIYSTIAMFCFILIWRIVLMPYILFSSLLAIVILMFMGWLYKQELFLIKDSIKITRKIS